MHAELKKLGRLADDLVIFVQWTLYKKIVISAAALKNRPLNSWCLKDFKALCPTLCFTNRWRYNLRIVFVILGSWSSMKATQTLLVQLILLIQDEKDHVDREQCLCVWWLVRVSYLCGQGRKRVAESRPFSTESSGGERPLAMELCDRKSAKPQH